MGASLKELISLVKAGSIISQICKDLEEGVTRTLDNLSQEGGISEIRVSEKLWIEDLLKVVFKTGFFAGINFIWILVSLIPKVILISCTYTFYHSLNPITITYIKLIVISVVTDWLFIVTPLLFMNWLLQKHKSIVNEINSYIDEKKHFAPISRRVLKKHRLNEEEINLKFLNRFVKPIQLRHIQVGLSVTYDRKYQLISFFISFFFTVFILFLTKMHYSLSYYFREEIPLRIEIYYSRLFLIPFIWGILGILFWTCVLSYFTCISINWFLGHVRIPRYKPLFYHYKDLIKVYISKFIYSAMLIGIGTAWVFLWSLPQVLPHEERLAAFSTSITFTSLFFSILIIAILYALIDIHKSMEQIKCRKLEVIEEELENTFLERDINIEKYRLIQEEYLNALHENTWPFNLANVTQIIISASIYLISIIIQAILLGL